MTSRTVSSSEYDKLRCKVGTLTQVARLLGVTLRTMQRRERSRLPVTKEAFLALKHLAESPDYARERRPINTEGVPFKVLLELDERRREELSAPARKGAETKRRRRMEREEAMARERDRERETRS